MAIVRLESGPRDRGRRFSMLVPFLQKAEFDHHLQAGGFSLWASQPPDMAWAAAHAAMAGAPRYVPSPPQPLPAQLKSAVAHIQQRQTYRREYESKADVHIGIVPIDALIAPQALADLDYVDELTAIVSSAADLEADLNFAFPVGSLPEPLVNGNTLVFNGQTANILVNPVPQHRRADEDVEIVLRASARPNYVFVAEFGERLVLLNGVHKVLALLRAGRTAIPAIIRRATSIPELGLAPSTTLLMHLDKPRPPLVSDFLQQLAVQVERRPTRTLTRVAIQVDQITFPE